MSSTPKPATSRRKRGAIVLGLYLAASAMVFYAMGIHEEPHDLKQIVRVGLGLPTLLIVAWALGRLRPVLAAGITTVVCLIAAELVLSRMNVRQDGLQHLTLRDPRLGWRFEPGREVVVEDTDYRTVICITSEGFRDVEPDPEEARPIVAVLGDSFTSNIGVHLPETFTSVLDGLVTDRTVRNCGVNGYGQVQELLLLEDLLAKGRLSEVLVVLYVRNDFDDNLGTLDEAHGIGRPHAELAEDGSLRLDPRVEEPPEKRFLERIEAFLEGSRVRALLAGAILRLQRRERDMRLRDQPPEWRFCRRELAPREQAALRTTELLLGRMNETCRDAGARFGVVLAPTIWQVNPQKWIELIERSGMDATLFDLARPQRELSAWCAEAGIRCLDLLPELRTLAEEGEVLYHPREQHWNALGNRLVAEALHRWLEAESD